MFNPFLWGQGLSSHLSATPALETLLPERLPNEGLALSGCQQESHKNQ